MLRAAGMLRYVAVRGQAQCWPALPSTDGRRSPGPGRSCGQARARLLVAGVVERGLHEDLSDHYLECFIPFDRHVLLSMLEKKLSCILDQERDSLPAVLACAEASTMKHYYSVLERLMTLYEPINPDRDTLPDLSLDGAVELEQEKVFLENLGPILEQANFNSLSDDIIQYALSYHDPLFKSQVIAEIENYEYVKFWALGLRPGAPPMERQRSIKSSKWWLFARMVKTPMHRRYCKRVLMAARVRGGSLALKSFKDIPLENLESLLPAVRMHIPLTDRTFLYLSLLAGGTALFANLTVLGFYNLKLDLAVLLLVFGLLMVIRRHRLFQRTRDLHALDHAITLYTKSTSNNGDMLVSLVRRAQQEHIKEIILAYGFSLLPLLNQGQPRDDVEMAELLTSRVSEWLQECSGLPVIFNGVRALTNLRALQGQRNGR